MVVYRHSPFNFPQLAVVSHLEHVVAEEGLGRHRYDLVVDTVE